MLSFPHISLLSLLSTIALELPSAILANGNKNQTLISNWYCNSYSRFAITSNSLTFRNIIIITVISGSIQVKNMRKALFGRDHFYLYCSLLCSHTSSAESGESSPTFFLLLCSTIRSYMTSSYDCPFFPICFSQSLVAVFRIIVVVLVNAILHYVPQIVMYRGVDRFNETLSAYI
jgi:hypothetical protein